MQNQITVTCPSRMRWRDSIRYKHKLRACGLDKEKNGIFTGILTDHQTGRLEKYCKKHHLRISINDSFSKRGNDYRKTFFNHTVPILGRYYFCVYCGKIMSINSRMLTVDHLYPVGKVDKDHRLQSKLRRMGIDNVNNNKNLVAACKKCNARKGKKTGWWVLRGKIGRHNTIWIIIHLFRSGILLYLAYKIILYALKAMALG